MITLFSLRFELEINAGFRPESLVPQVLAHLLKRAFFIHRTFSCHLLFFYAGSYAFQKEILSAQLNCLHSYVELLFQHEHKAHRY